MSGTSSSGTRYYEYDVDSDGNCYYRSIYNAAKFHRVPGTFKRLLDCFKLPNNISEDDFSVEIRKKIGKHIDNGIFEIMADTQMQKELASATTNAQRVSIFYNSKSFIKNLYDNAISNPEYFNIIVGEMSSQLQDEIMRRGGARKIASLPEEEAINLLKHIFKTIIGIDKVYASEVDIMIVNFILETCGLYSIQVNPFMEFASSNTDKRLKMPDMWPAINFNKSLIPLYIRRVRGNHYHFFAPTDKAPVDKGGEKIPKEYARSVGDSNIISGSSAETNRDNIKLETNISKPIEKSFEERLAKLKKQLAILKESPVSGQAIPVGNTNRNKTRSSGSGSSSGATASLVNNFAKFGLSNAEINAQRKAYQKFESKKHNNTKKTKNSIAKKLASVHVNSHTSKIVSYQPQFTSSSSSSAKAPQIVSYPPPGYSYPPQFPSEPIVNSSSSGSDSSSKDLIAIIDRITNEAKKVARIAKDDIIKDILNAIVVKNGGRGAALTVIDESLFNINHTIVSLFPTLKVQNIGTREYLTRVNAADIDPRMEVGDILEYPCSDEFVNIVKNPSIPLRRYQISVNLTKNIKSRFNIYRDNLSLVTILCKNAQKEEGMIDLFNRFKAALAQEQGIEKIVDSIQLSYDDGKIGNSIQNMRDNTKIVVSSPLKAERSLANRIANEFGPMRFNRFVQTTIQEATKRPSKNFSGGRRKTRRNN